MNAASKGHLPVVLYLLTKQKANPLIRNKWGETAFDIAAAVFEVWICEVCIKHLDPKGVVVYLPSCIDSPTSRIGKMARNHYTLQYVAGAYDYTYNII